MTDEQSAPDQPQLAPAQLGQQQGQQINLTGDQVREGLQSILEVLGGASSDRLLKLRKEISVGELVVRAIVSGEQVLVPAEVLRRAQDAQAQGAAAPPPNRAARRASKKARSKK